MASAVIASGKATILINSSQTEARLVFTPDPEGEGWDAAAINKLALAFQLHAFSDLKALETFLSKAAKAKTHDPMEMVFAHGSEPEEGHPEIISWEVLPVPGDIAPYQAEALNKAGRPEIFTIKVEKIKRETKVKKPGALPFMAGKEEISVTWEKKETREKVEVNPAVKEVMYADRDAKIGTVSPAVPGKPGKNVFGKPIQPKAMGESTCLLGDGISREKNALYAQASGFIRIGENWADMVHLAMHSYRITTGSDGLTFYLYFDPGEPQFAPPSGEEILDEVIKKGAGESGLIRASEIDDAITEAIKMEESLEAFPLFRVQEAIARVAMSQDKTLAVLNLRKGVAGAAPLEMKAINQALKDTDVRGYDTEKLKMAIYEFMDGRELELHYVLAEGRPSTRGKDREVQVFAPTLHGEEQQEVLTHINEWRTQNPYIEVEIEPKTATGFAFVKEGAMVAKVTSTAEGEEGVDIYGNVIPGLPGNDPDIKLFRGLEIHGSGIVVSKAGLLILKASERSFHGVVIDYQDAMIVIHVSADGMEAYGDFTREIGAGSPLSVENIKKAFSSIGVQKGIDWREVEKACAQARARGSVSQRVLARGEAPIARDGTAFKWLVTLEADGSDKSVQIKSGTPIVELSEPFAEGWPGYDVRGNELPISEAIDLTLEFDDSIQEEVLESNDPLAKGKRLIAARSGDLRLSDGKRLNISSIKTIPGDATGELKFSGEIRISGNMLPGCKILGGSHVTVGGFAEEAFISVGGRAVVSQGFKGNGRGVIRSRAGIESAFVERASITSMGDIELEKGALLSSVKTNGKLSVLAENGKLLGGIYQARYGIDAANIGSEKGGRTEISFGQDYLLKNEINACEEQKAKLLQSLSQMEERVQKYLQRKLPIPDKVKTEKMRLLELQKQFNLKIFNMREKFEEHFDSEIRIRGTIFPGVVIESHNRYYEIMQKRSMVIFYFDRESGRIKEKHMN